MVRFSTSHFDHQLVALEVSILQPVRLPQHATLETVRTQSATVIHLQAIIQSKPVAKLVPIVVKHAVYVVWKKQLTDVNHQWLSHQSLCHLSHIVGGGMRLTLAPKGYRDRDTLHLLIANGQSY